MKKILIYGDSPSIPTGYGQQVKMLAEEFSHRGYPVHVVGKYGLPNRNNKLYRESLCPVWDHKEFDRILTRERPDVIIMVTFVYEIKDFLQCRSTYRNCPVYAWLAWEASSVPADLQECFIHLPVDSIVHLSPFSQELWKSYFKSTNLIPHGVDRRIFYPRGDRKELRKKWSDKLNYYIRPDAFVVLGVDRNDQRKRWDLSFDCIRRLKDMEVPVQYIIHTKKDKDETGFDIEKMINVYGIKRESILTGFDWNKAIPRQDLAELYTISDVRLSLSNGEGFGIPLIEAMACGCLPVSGNHTAVSHIVPHELLTNISGLACENLTLWAVPNADETAKRLRDLYLNPLLRKTLVEKNLELVKQYDHVKVVDQWEELVNKEVDVDWEAARFSISAVDIELAESKVLSAALRIMAGPDDTVFQVGAGNGKYLEIMKWFGLSVRGMEKDPDRYNRSAPFIRDYIDLVQTYALDDWPKARFLVIANEFELISDEELKPVVNRLLDYDWVITRSVDTEIVWDKKRQNTRLPAYYSQLLVKAGLTRRIDVEKALADKIGILDISFCFWSGKNIPTNVLPKFGA